LALSDRTRSHATPRLANQRSARRKKPPRAVLERLSVVTAATLLLLAGCSLRHHVDSTNVPDHDLRGAIEACLSAKGMEDVSERWPESDYIERWPDRVVGVWESPPVEYPSWFHGIVELSGSHPYCNAWIRPRGESYSISLRSHDSCAPAIADCVKASASGISVASRRLVAC
jgi:hypothetical protein